MTTTKHQTLNNIKFHVKIKFSKKIINIYILCAAFFLCFSKQKNENFSSKIVADGFFMRVLCSLVTSEMKLNSSKKLNRVYKFFISGAALPLQTNNETIIINSFLQEPFVECPKNSKRKLFLFTKCLSIFIFLHHS